ncbi:MAG TPA: hypothetical protein IAC71_06450 [Candidatus Caccomonas pullistercoris]|nr:hypothetical protein [Candidatus Caccomonas pullistercoris]
MRSHRAKWSRASWKDFQPAPSHSSLRTKRLTHSPISPAATGRAAVRLARSLTLSSQRPSAMSAASTSATRSQRPAACPAAAGRG